MPSELYEVIKDITFEASSFSSYEGRTNDHLFVLKGTKVFIDNLRLSIPLTDTIFIVKNLQERIFREYFKKLEESEVVMEKKKSKKIINKKFSFLQ